MDRRLFLTATAATLTLAACAPAMLTSPLSREETRALRFDTIEVRTVNTLFSTEAARAKSTTLASALRTRLEREFSDKSGPGMVLRVDVTRLSLASATSTAFGRDISRLQGVATLVDRMGVERATFPIQVEAGRAAESTSGALARAAINSTDGFYKDLLTAFGEDLREQIFGKDLPGAGLVRSVQRNL